MLNELKRVLNTEGARSQRKCQEAMHQVTRQKAELVNQVLSEYRIKMLAYIETTTHKSARYKNELNQFSKLEGLKPKIPDLTNKWERETLKADEGWLIRVFKKFLSPGYSASLNFLLSPEYRFPPTNFLNLEWDLYALLIFYSVLARDTEKIGQDVLARIDYAAMKTMHIAMLRIKNAEKKGADFLKGRGGRAGKKVANEKFVERGFEILPKVLEQAKQKGEVWGHSKCARLVRDQLRDKYKEGVPSQIVFERAFKESDHFKKRNTRSSHLTYDDRYNTDHHM